MQEPTERAQSQPLALPSPASAPREIKLSSTADFQEVQDRLEVVKRALNEVMVRDLDFGKIPGCGNKDILFKAGAEKLKTLFNLGYTVQKIDTREMDGGHREVEVTIRFTHLATGWVLGDGVGSCNTRERKMNRDKGGPSDAYNNVLKMAKKRAFVDGVLTVTGSSGFLTQDLEDDPELHRKETRAALPARATVVTPQPTGPEETRRGVVERAWPNDYQGNRYYFAKVNGDQWQTTEGSTGEELLSLIGKEVVAEVEPAPKPGKFYLKSVRLNAPATDPSTAAPSIKVYAMPGSDPATKSFVEAEKRMQVVKPIEEETDQIPGVETEVILSDSEKRQMEKFEKMTPELQGYLLVAAKSRNWVRADMKDLYELDNAEARTLCQNVTWLRQAVASLRDDLRAEQARTSASEKQGAPVEAMTPPEPANPVPQLTVEEV